MRKTIFQTFLQLELQRCQDTLAEVAMRPLVAWLQERGVTGLTLILCGLLATFPFPTIPINNEQTVGDILPTSVAPAARLLLREKRQQGHEQRAGLYAIGNPTTSYPVLEWSQAEALSLIKIASDIGLPAEAKIRKAATRSWLIEKLRTGLIVDASCHGSFHVEDFLRSALILAQEEQLMLADMLHGQVDLQGLRLLILSACQTAMLDPQAMDEVHSLAVGMLQAGAKATLAALWSVDDMATYLLMVRFAQEWLPRRDEESPVIALARAQRWLRTVTNRELQQWHITHQIPDAEAEFTKHTVQVQDQHSGIGTQDELIRANSSADRYSINGAEKLMQLFATRNRKPDDRPYIDPFYWAGFQLTGW